MRPVLARLHFALQVQIFEGGSHCAGEDILRAHHFRRVGLNLHKNILLHFCQIALDDVTHFEAGDGTRLEGPDNLITYVIRVRNSWVA